VGRERYFNWDVNCEDFNIFEREDQSGYNAELMMASKKTYNESILNSISSLHASQSLNQGSTDSNRYRNNCNENGSCRQIQLQPSKSFMTPQIAFFNPATVKFDTSPKVSEVVADNRDQSTLAHNPHTTPPPTLKSPDNPQFGEDRLVGIYTIRERQQKIAAFRQKKMQRIFRKHVKYICRKRLAEERPRLKGRFTTRS